MVSRRNRSVIDLLSDSNRARTVIAAHKKASDRYILATKNYQKQKAEALEALKQAEHENLIQDERERRLTKESNILEQLKNQLDSREYKIECREKELNDHKKLLDSQDEDLKHKIDQFNKKINDKELTIKQKISELSDLYKKAADKFADLNKREEAIVTKEKAISTLADTLR